MAESTPSRNPSTAQHRRGAKKKKYTNEERKKIMEMIKEGARNTDITSAMNVPESTVRSMRKQLATLPATLDVYAKYSEGKKRMENTDRSRQQTRCPKA